MLELLAPAGSMDALRAAVQNGADAVYLGYESLNARQGAKNFTPQTVTEAVRYCHVRGVAVHLALNTLVSDRELEQAAEMIRQAAVSGVDAFIVQDLGVAEFCRRIAPQIPIHGSTQMTIHSLPGVQMCAAWGMKRVVLSRELSREEIAFLCQNSPIEIEVFAHGALCMCYSGQCYLSAAIGGRSGNRGRCAQPCRQSYGYGRWEEKYPLSLKDNCLVPYLRELEAFGVTSIKLEGRMKRPEYVAAVTGVYRQALDTGVVTQEMMDRLLAAFNRQGFTDGYYTRRLGPEMFGTRQEPGGEAPWMKEARLTYEAGEAPRVGVRMAASVTGRGSRLTVADPEGRACRVDGPPAEIARKMWLTPEVLAARLAKTGGTPYRCLDVQAEVEPGYTLSAAAINGMRRDALNQLTALRARRETPRLGRPPKIPQIEGPKGHPAVNAQVFSRDQVTERLLRTPLAVLYVPIHLLRQDPAWCRSLLAKVRVCAVLPRIAHDTELPKLRQAMLDLRALGVREVLAGNPGLLPPARECGMAVRGDFGLNLFNSAAVTVARELELRSATLSFEMTLPQIRDVSKPLDCEILAYGRLPLMVTENCVLRGRTGECSCHLAPTKLMDKTGAEFPVVRDADTCRSVVLNGRKLNLLDRQEDLTRLGLWAIRLVFTTENSKEVDQVLQSLESPAAFDPGSCTRGLYLRGVE